MTEDLQQVPREELVRRYAAGDRAARAELERRRRVEILAERARPPAHRGIIPRRQRPTPTHARTWTDGRAAAAGDDKGD